LFRVRAPFPEREKTTKRRKKIWCGRRGQDPSAHEGAGDDANRSGTTVNPVSPKGK